MADQTAPPGVAPTTPEQKKPAGGLFGGGAQKKEDPYKHLAEIAGELNNVARRLRVLEERYTGMRKKSQITEQNMLSNSKKMMTEVKASQSQLDDFRRDLDSLKDNFKIMITEIRECAKKQDVDVLQKYINMWDPIDFVTRNELLKLIRYNVEATFEDLNVRLQQEDYIKEQIKLILRDFKPNP